jgi:hypothetical protein
LSRFFTIVFIRHGGVVVIVLAIEPKDAGLKAAGPMDF